MERCGSTCVFADPSGVPFIQLALLVSISGGGERLAIDESHMESLREKWLANQSVSG